MKLAEALQERADLTRAIQQLNSRLINNVLIQEGESALEDPEELKQQLDQKISRLTYLINQINQTNCQTVIENQTLTEMMAQKDTLLLKIKVYQDVINNAGQITQRARGSEIKIKPTISIHRWQKELDKLYQEMRLLDNQLQASNWITDLIE